MKYAVRSAVKSLSRVACKVDVIISIRTGLEMALIGRKINGGSSCIKGEIRTGNIPGIITTATRIRSGEI